MTDWRNTQMEYCAKCVMPNTIYSLSIDENGICDACRTAEAKKEIDWEARSIQHGFSVSEKRCVGTLWDSENLNGEFVDIHDYLIYMKYGFGRATSQACIDIRHGRLMQEEAIELVDKYDGEVVDSFINKNIFEIDEGGNPLNNDQGRLIKKAAFDPFNS